MMQQPNFLVLGGLLLALAWPIAAGASGSYGSRPVKPPVHREAGKLDRNQYELGKRIFTGKLALEPVDSARAAEQGPRLRQLQDRLPKSAQKANLPALAGRLTPAQLEALEHYAKQRYKLN